MRVFPRQNHPNFFKFFRTDDFGWSRNFFPTKSPHEAQGGGDTFLGQSYIGPTPPNFRFIRFVDWSHLLQLLQRGRSQRKWWRPKKGWFKTLNKVKILKSHEITTIFKSSGGGTRIFCNLQFVFVASLQSVDPGNSLSWVPTKIGCYTSLRDLISVLFKKRRGNNSTFCRARLHKSKTTFFFWKGKPTSPEIHRVPPAQEQQVDPSGTVTLMKATAKAKAAKNAAPRISPACRVEDRPTLDTQKMLSRMDRKLRKTQKKMEKKKEKRKERRMRRRERKMEKRKKAGSRKKVVSGRLFLQAYFFETCHLTDDCWDMAHVRCAEHIASYQTIFAVKSWRISIGQVFFSMEDFKIL